MKNNFKIIIDGIEEKYPSKDKTDAMWNLGAKFGGLKYNEMFDNGQIIYKNGYVYVNTKSPNIDDCLSINPNG